MLNIIIIIMLFPMPLVPPPTPLPVCIRLPACPAACLADMPGKRKQKDNGK
jgi:hypothetical protein